MIALHDDLLPVSDVCGDCTLLCCPGSGGCCDEGVGPVVHCAGELVCGKLKTKIIFNKTFNCNFLSNSDLWLIRTYSCVVRWGCCCCGISCRCWFLGCGPTTSTTWYKTDSWIAAAGFTSQTGQISRWPPRRGHLSQALHSMFAGYLTFCLMLFQRFSLLYY